MRPYVNPWVAGAGGGTGVSATASATTSTTSAAAAGRRGRHGGGGSGDASSGSRGSDSDSSGDDNGGGRLLRRVVLTVAVLVAFAWLTLWTAAQAPDPIDERAPRGGRVWDRLPFVRGRRGSGSGGGDSGSNSQQGQGPRRLVMSSSSCEDIVPPKPWLADTPSTERYYDVVLFDYSANNTCAQYVSPSRSLRLIHMPRAYKWPAVYAYFGTPEGRAALARYDAYFISDDDVDFHGDAAAVARLFDICDTADLYVCQPALSPRSAENFDITSYAPHEASEADEAASATAYVRLTGFVEQMSPLFTREALLHFMPYFRGMTHAWGIDALWCVGCCFGCVYWRACLGCTRSTPPTQMQERPGGAPGPARGHRGLGGD